MLKLKLQYFCHLMQRAKSLEKTLILGKSKGKRRRRGQRMRWLDSITNSMDMNSSKLPEIVEDKGTQCAIVHRVTKSDKTQRLITTICGKWHLLVFFFNIYLFIWLHRVLVVACEFFIAACGFRCCSTLAQLLLGM